MENGSQSSCTFKHGLAPLNVALLILIPVFTSCQSRRELPCLTAHLLHLSVVWLPPVISSEAEARTYYHAFFWRL